MARAKPEVVCDLFMRYASKASHPAATWLVMPAGLRRMLRDLRALDGVPHDLTDAYVRQLYLRADMDRDGALSLEEFVLWLASEVAALLPFGSWQCLYAGHHRLVPLYNRFVRTATCAEARRPDGRGAGGEGGAWGLAENPCGTAAAAGGGSSWQAGGRARRTGWEEDSKRRRAPGLTVRQLADMLLAAGVSSGGPREEGEVRGAAKLALQGVRAERARAERVQGQMEGANHLSWPLFVRSLMITASKGMGLAQVLLRLMSGGVPPPPALHPPPPPGEDNELLDNLYMVSDVEGELFEIEEEAPAVRGGAGGGWGAGTADGLGGCDSGRQRVWLLSNPVAMQDMVNKARRVLRRRLRGASLPPTFCPAAQSSRLCCRNVRAAFHRYCARWNKGPLPPRDLPASPRRPGPGHGPGPGPGFGGAGGSGRQAPATSAEPRPLDDPWGWQWGACACCFRSLSTMELPAWVRLCGDSATLSAALQHPGGGLTPHRLEAVFTYCATIAGVYLPDDSTGVHDMPVSPPRRGTSAATGRAAAAAQGGLPRGRATPGATVGGRYGASVKGLEPMRRSLPAVQRGALRLSSAWSPLARSRGGGGGKAEAEGGAVAGAGARVPEPEGAAEADREDGWGSPPAYPNAASGHHRPPVLSLTFIQFLEALRLLAEEVVGHPVRNDEVEAVLLCILGDICGRPAPAPDTTSCGGLSASGYSLRPSSAPPRY